MQKTEILGFFEKPIEELPESKTVKELLLEKEDLGKYFTPVKCVFKRTQFKQKDGTLSEIRYTLKVQLHPAIEETVTSKDSPLINRNEFGLLCLEFLKPMDCAEISFNGYVRYLRGVSDSANIKSEDKSFIRVELFISENLAPLSFFLNNGTKLYINRLSKLSAVELALIKATAFIGKQYRLSASAIQEIVDSEPVTNGNQ